MKKIIFLITIFFSLNLFANPCGKNYVLRTDVSPNPSALVMSYGTSYTSDTSAYNTYPVWDCSSNTYHYWSDFVVDSRYFAYTGTYNVSGVYHVFYYTPVVTCPNGGTPDLNGICTAPVQCSWATNPPWSDTLTGYNSVSCNINTINNSKNDLSPSYDSAASFCPTNNICYGVPTTCPTGQIYKKSSNRCEYPTPDNGNCPAGFTKTNYSVGALGSQVCHTLYTCKNNSSIEYDITVSCGASGNSSPVTGQNGPITPTKLPDQTGTSNTAGVSQCNYQRQLAQINCVSPNVLSFSCDPTTGTPTTSCNPPSKSTDTPLNSGDSSTAATTADIKNLTNTLPQSIKDVLKDYFSDGSSPYLSTIKGTLDETKTLQATANDTLTAIDASTEASLSQQKTTNQKLDTLKTSVDALGNKISDGSGYNGDSLPTSSDLASDSDHSISGTLNGMVSDVTSIGTQFSNLKNQVTNGFTPPTFNDGSMPVLRTDFHGYPITADTAQIANVISPYSPIIAILVYVTLMILMFRSVFNFLSRGI